MKDMMSMKLGMERCTSCDHRWIDYEGIRDTCYICGGTSISECVSLREIRDSIAALRNEDKKYLDTYAKRTVILKQLYREVAELSLQRAQEIYSKVKQYYTRGVLTDKVIDQLILAFRLFSELGVHKSAAATAYMIALGYAQRGIEKEIRQIDDLSDLVTARQWFIRLSAKDWEAVMNLHIGEKAMAAICADQKILQTMAQVSVWHLYKVRDYYFDKRNTKMVERAQFDIERATQLLTSYTQGASQIEAARIAGHSTVKHGEHVRMGLEVLGHSMRYGLKALGEHIDNYGVTLSRALQATSANVTNAMYTLAASKLRGRSLDRRMSDVGQLIASTAKEIPEKFIQPVKELSAKFALGAAGSATASDITSEPQVVNLAESVLPETKKSEETLKNLEEPSIKLTGTLLDMLVSKGLSKVVEQLEESEKARKNV
jgi:predicted RNA-binding Zn-ribbon protein involved in translation (DUF1610 family)